MNGRNWEILVNIGHLEIPDVYLCQPSWCSLASYVKGALCWGIRERYRQYDDDDATRRSSPLSITYKTAVHCWWDNYSSSAHRLCNNYVVHKSSIAAYCDCSWDYAIIIAVCKALKGNVQAPAWNIAADRSPIARHGKAIFRHLGILLIDCQVHETCKAFSGVLRHL